MAARRMRRLGIAIAAGLLCQSLGAGTLPAQAQNYVKPNSSYDANPVPSYWNEVPEAKPLWSAEVGRPGERYIFGGGNRLATGEGLAYYLKGGTLTAADARTGAVRWTYGNGFEQSVYEADGDVFVYGADDSAHRVDGASGALRWKFDLSPHVQERGYGVQLAFDEQAVYIAYSGGILAVARYTGKVLWSNDSVSFTSALISADDRLLVNTTESGALTVDVTYAIDKRTGKTLWRAGSQASPLLVRDGRMYSPYTWPPNDMTKDQYKVNLVDLATGEIVEERNYVPVPEGKDPLSTQARLAATDGASLFVQAADGTIYAYDIREPADGQQPKRYTGPGRWIAGPYQNKLFFTNADGNGISAVKLVDRNVVYYEGLNNPVSRLDFYDKGMYVGQTDGDVYALDVTTGKALFRYATGARDFDPFQIENGVLFVQAEDMLYAFAVPNELLQPLPVTPTAGIDAALTDAKLVIDGTPVVFDPSPVMIDQRMYVPLRLLYEAVGAMVQYDDGTGDAYVYFKGQAFTAPKGQILNETTYVPLREAGAPLGIAMVWDDETRTVTIET